MFYDNNSTKDGEGKEKDLYKTKSIFTIEIKLVLI